MRTIAGISDRRRAIALPALSAAVALVAVAPAHAALRRDQAAPAAATGWVSTTTSLHDPSSRHRGATYGGTTSAEDPLVIVLAHNRHSIRHVTTSFEASCASGDGIAFLFDAAGPLTVSPSGQFAGRHQGGSSIGDGLATRRTVDLTGRVQGRVTTGTLSYHADIVDTTGKVVDTCNAEADFGIVSAAGRVYGGQTSQGGPVVLELTRSRRSIAHLHVAWAADCSPEGYFQIGDTLRRFPIAGSRFGRDFTVEYPPDSGGLTTFAYSVAGHVRRAAASGTFEATGREIDPAGATSATCASGLIGFNARSG